MKIISLNTWGGKGGKENLLQFFADHKSDIDVFCLQEVWSASYEHLGTYTAGGVEMIQEHILVHGKQELSALLSDHVGYFRSHFLDDYGLFTLVHKKYIVTEEKEVFVHKEKGYVPKGDAGHHARNVQYLQITHKKNPLTIMNFHGLWNGKGKTDSPERIAQSEKIVEFLKTIKGEYVFCGDFNLLPDTESISIIEKTGARNLVKENGITSTRTALYTKPEKFADYIFVSKGVKVKEFKVLHDVVSDHAPLYIEIE